MTVVNGLKIWKNNIFSSHEQTFLMVHFQYFSLGSLKKSAIV